MNSESLVAKGLELRACAARPGRLLSGLHLADLLSPVPQDGRGAGDADRRAVAPAGRLALGRHQGACGRGAGGEIRQAARNAVAPVRRDRRDLPQGAERNPGPGQAQAARRPHRLGDLAQPAGRREGRDLRGLAGAQRRGRQIGRRPIFHAARADRGDRRRSSIPIRARPSTTRPAAPAASCWRRGTT